MMSHIEVLCVDLALNAVFFTALELDKVVDEGEDVLVDDGPRFDRKLANRRLVLLVRFKACATKEKPNEEEERASQ